MSCAVNDEVISTGTTVLDYGCGRGGDVRRLNHIGITAFGYDPAFFPDAGLEETDVVNLGYVVNVIEDARERASVLHRAWSLAKSTLIVSARLEGEGRALEGKAHQDGLVTSKGTFQVFFTQDGFRAWVEATLGRTATMAAPGILYIFREEEAEQSFLARRVRRTRGTGEELATVSDVVEADSEMEPLVAFFCERGRLPRNEEWAN